MFRLLCTKPDLLVASLMLPSAVDQVSKSDFFGIRSPSVREYGIVGDIVAD